MKYRTCRWFNSVKEFCWRKFLTANRLPARACCHHISSLYSFFHTYSKFWSISHLNAPYLKSIVALIWMFVGPLRTSVTGRVSTRMFLSGCVCLKYSVILVFNMQACSQDMADWRIQTSRDILNNSAHHSITANFDMSRKCFY